MNTSLWGAKLLQTRSSWQGKTCNISFAFAGTVLARGVHYKHASLTDPGRKVSMIMITHIHTSCSARLESLQKLSCVFAVKLTMTNIVNKMCFQMSGACSRQDMSGLLLLDLPPLVYLHTDQYVEMYESYYEWMLQDEPSWFTLQRSRTKSG